MQTPNLIIGWPLIIAAVLCALLSVVGSWILVWQAPRWGLQDLPNERSSHRTPTPRGGGMAIVVAFAVILPFILPDGRSAGGTALIVAAAALFLALIGLIDDVRGLGLTVRLAAQSASVVALALALRAFTMPTESDLGLFEAVFGIGTGARWLPDGLRSILDVGIGIAMVLAGIWWINLYNFMDGIDGLAASQALFMLLAGLMLRALARGTLDFGGTDVASIILAGAVAGFLLMNWSPARLFLGDAGSLFLGFSTLALAAHDVTWGDISVWAWLILGAAFLTDATVTLLRRAVTGQAVASAHRSHLYQRLSRRWNSHAKVTLVYLLINLLWLLPLSLLAQRMPSWAPMFLGIACLPLALVAWRSGAGLKDT